MERVGLVVRRLECGRVPEVESKSKKQANVTHGHVVVFGDAASVSAQCAERDRLIDEQADFVLVLELHLSTAKKAPHGVHNSLEAEPVIAYKRY